MTDRPHPSQWHVPWHSSLLVVQFQDRSFHEINCQSESKQQDEKFTNIHLSLVYEHPEANHFESVTSKLAKAS